MMNSVSPECQELKETYDACFNTWFKDKFLQGFTETDSSCVPLFKAYQNCVKEAVKKRGLELFDIEKDVLGTEKEQKAPPGSQKAKS